MLNHPLADSWDAGTDSDRSDWMPTFPDSGLISLRFGASA